MFIQIWRVTKMIKDLKNEVCRANKMLAQHGLVKLTWGNVSAINLEEGDYVIKPSGVEYELLTEEDMVVVNL